MPGLKGTLSEWKEGKLHSGSKHGPVVKSQKQAIAIGLSEERKAGHKVAPKHHSFESSNQPFGQTKAGEAAAHAIPQGHKVSGPKSDRMDGAGKAGHDMELRSRTEHKEPHHPAGSHTKQGHDPMVEHGKAGYPGEHMRMGHEHDLVGEDYSQTAHEPAVLKAVHGPAGGIGTHAGMGTKPSGYGHGMHQRDGVHRLSGHPNAHRLGQRKK